ncbi:MAG TPA: chorismate synthase [Acidobacteriota bacterium]
MSLRILRLMTAGESHGPMLVGILEGLPAGLAVDVDAIDTDLKRRMGGYGRGKRMKIESDRIRIVGGVRHGQTLGGPVAWLIENKDWKNWQHVMGAEGPDAGPAAGSGAVGESGNRPSPDPDARKVTRPRPGHADLAGGLKYDRGDLRDVLERASARETASRVAAGGFCKQLLTGLGVEIASHVLKIGGAGLEPETEVPFATIAAAADASPVRCVEAGAEAAMIAAIDAASDQLDTLGGVFEVAARNVPPGLGSHVQWDRKLDARIAHAMVSIPAQKAVEIGRGVWAADRPGSEVHDAIAYDKESRAFSRPTNRAGGTEGGVTYGGELRVRVYMKPLSTLRQPLPSVDIATGEPVDAVVQRSDVCAVPAAAIVGEAMLALVLADACLEKFGGDSLTETRRNWQGYLEQIRAFPPGRRQ